MPVLVVSVADKDPRLKQFGMRTLSKPLDRDALLANVSDLLTEDEKRPVLVIDDDPKIRRQTCELLHSEGYLTVEARNGREGLALARSENPTLVLCDITMPEMNGHRVVEALRQESATAHLPFVFLTGWSDRTDQRTGMNLGADDYLVKPVEPAELLSTIAARLRRRVLFLGRQVAPQGVGMHQQHQQQRPHGEHHRVDAPAGGGLGRGKHQPWTFGITHLRLLS